MEQVTFTTEQSTSTVSIDSIAQANATVSLPSYSNVAGATRFVVRKTTTSATATAALVLTLFSQPSTLPVTPDRLLPVHRSTDESTPFTFAGSSAFNSTVVAMPIRTVEDHSSAWNEDDDGDLEVEYDQIFAMPLKRAYQIELDVREVTRLPARFVDTNFEDDGELEA